MKAQRIVFLALLIATASVGPVASAELPEHSCAATRAAITSLQQQALHDHTACENLLGLRQNVAQTILSARDGEIDRSPSLHWNHTQTGLSALHSRERGEWESAAALAFTAFIFSLLFFPAAAPIAGRILAALVNRMPGLAGAAGVVSVEAFDALIKAIERSKTNIHLGNDAASTSVRAVSLDNLHANLARELDASHKRLVHARKRTLNLDTPHSSAA